MQISARIDRLLTQYAEKLGGKLSNKQINAEIADHLGLKSDEAVRRWRERLGLPRWEKLEPLVKLLNERGIQTSEENILFGLPVKGTTAVQLRERIAEQGPELELLLIYRATNHKGKEQILEQAHTICLAYPMGSKVIPLRSQKKRH